MQSLDARTQYRNSFHCAARIFSEEGVFRFWRGATPRLARLVLSGGIVFTVYEKGASSFFSLHFSPIVEKSGTDLWFYNDTVIVLLGGRAV
jgi:hypothetical protein